MAYAALLGVLLLSVGAPSSFGTWSDADRSARLISGPEHIVYPAAMLERRVEGVVIAEYIVELDGSIAIESFVALESPDPQFEAAVTRALAHFLYAPAERDGAPIRERIRFRFRFALAASRGD